jgi:uncharacterized membrane protein YbhN (UPF0104 family)
MAGADIRASHAVRAAPASQRPPLTEPDAEAAEGFARRPLRRQALLLAQIGLSAGLLAYLILKVDPKEAASAVMNGEPYLLGIAALQLALQIPLLALRWSMISASLGAAMPIRVALGYSWIGAFAAQVVPSVGGDALRMWLHWVRYRSRRIAIYGVALERLVMVASLLALISGSYAGLTARGVPPAAVTTAMLLLAGVVVAAAVLVRYGDQSFRHSRFLPVRVLGHAAADVARFLRDGPRMAAVFILACVSYVNMAVVMWFIARGLHLDLALGDCIFLTPLVVFAAMLPISLGGWGVREGAAVLLFGLAGLSQPQALALSVLFGLLTIAVSLPGALIWLGTGASRLRKRHRE